MEKLQIYLMGPIDLFFGDCRLADFPTHKSKSLFAYLVLNRNQILPREVVAAEFWGDLPEKKARKALNTDLWRINQLLRHGGADPDKYLYSSSNGIGFRADSAYWLDIAQFDEILRRTTKITPEQADNDLINALLEAITLYRGGLLQGIFDDWCLVQREMLTTRYLSALEFLVHAYIAHKSWKQALIFSLKLLEIDPLQEHIHRAVMHCYHVMGNRPAAIKQYALCEQILRRELDIEPMAETTQSYQAILNVSARDLVVPSHHATAAVKRNLLIGNTSLEAINVAISNIDNARNWLLDASQQISGSSNPKPHP